MISTSSFSKEDMHRIGVRFHSARVLTGLKSDEFAKMHGLSPIIIKNWETGLALPRHQSIAAAITALKESGVFASSEWLLFGNGFRPNYYCAHQIENSASTDALINEQIGLFKKAYRAKGMLPIAVAIKDDAMRPIYCKGDLVGAVIVSQESVKSFISSQANNKQPWLISCAGGSFKLAYVFCHADVWFMNTKQDVELKEIAAPSFARIKWHYKIDD